MRFLVVVIFLLALLGACSPADLAKGAAKAALGGGGPKLAANVQAGKTNAQVLGRSAITEQKLIRPQARRIEQNAGDNAVRTERVENLVVRQDAPPWLWLLAFAGWMLPTPLTIWRAAWARVSTIWRGRNADR